MTLTRARELFKHWEKWPPTYIAVNLAWLTQKEEQTQTEHDFSAIAGMPGVQGDWVGPPPFLPKDVIRLAKEAEAKAKANEPQR